MKIFNTNIDDVKIIKPDVFYDERGYFLESINTEKLKNFGLNIGIVQENQTYSLKGTIRGFHYQLEPMAQTKLVRAIYGEILDIAVDVRKNSKTFGCYVKVILSEKNNHQIYIPKGFAHCALTLSDSSIMAYYVDNFYSVELSRTFRYDDPTLAIDWGMTDFIVKDSDKNAPYFKDINELF